MKVGKLQGNCSAKVIYNLGSAHEWRSTTKTHETFESFKAEMNKKIQNEEWDGNILYLATTFNNNYWGEGQFNEETWLKQLGFSSLEMSNGITVWAVDSQNYHERNK